MRRFLFAGAGAIGLMAAVHAFAAPDAALPFATRQTPSFDAGTNFTIGARIPDDVVLLAVPAEAASPEMRNYRFFRWKDYVVFVDPGSRRIVGVIE